jgi:shikimate dehydrogenase
LNDIALLSDRQLRSHLNIVIVYNDVLQSATINSTITARLMASRSILLGSEEKFMSTSLPTLCGSMAAHPYRMAVEVHNAAYRALGIDYTFVYFGITNPEEGVKAIRALGIRGMNVSMPFKSAVVPFLDKLDSAAAAIGAVNTIDNKDGILTGYNTDFIGAMRALQEVTDIPGKRVALLGAGGAARAIGYGLVTAGAEVNVYNRSIGKAERLAEDLGLKVGGTLEQFSEIGGFDILVNSTSVGFNAPDESPVYKKTLGSIPVVMDAVFIPVKTRLLQEAEIAGCTTIPGVRMLLHQACGQVELYTGHDAPLEVMEQVIEKEIKKMAA